MRRDVDEIDTDLRVLAVVIARLREDGGRPRMHRVDALLDERIESEHVRFCRSRQ